MIDPFCKRALQKRLYSAKETHNFKEPTNRSHLIHASSQCPSLQTPASVCKSDTLEGLLIICAWSKWGVCCTDVYGCVCYADVYG